MIVVHYFPIYWGVERRPPDRSFITHSTLHEVYPPFRQSTWAFRIRVSPWHWLHIGRYHYEAEVRRWGMDTEVDEISNWRGPSEEAAEDTGTDEVRPVDGGGLDQPDRVGDAANGRTVPWDAAHQGTRPWVGPC